MKIVKKIATEESKKNKENDAVRQIIAELVLVELVLRDVDAYQGGR